MASLVHFVVLYSFISSHCQAQGAGNLSAKSVSMIQERNLCNDSCTCSSDYIVVCNATQNVTFYDFMTMVPQHTTVLQITNADLLPSVVVTSNQQSDNIKFSPEIVTFEVSNSGLIHITSEMFASVPNVEQLILNHNNLTYIGHSDLTVLQSLRVLNLSHNSLTDISKDALKTLAMLRTLDLSYNKMYNLSSTSVFQFLVSLVSLDLSHNQLHYIHPRIFYNLNKLEVLHLDYNNLSSLQHEIFTNTSENMKLYLGYNPWNCHCGINWVVKELQQHNKTYLDIEHVLCSSPQHLESVKVVHLNTTSLQCEEPSFSSNSTFIPTNTSLHFMHSGYLHCSVDGHPKPSVYWLGPRGVLVHSSHQKWLPHNVHLFSDFQSWAGKPTYFNATVTALQNGSLLFKNFRYNFEGLYTCIAVNPMGSISASAYIQVRTNMVHHLIWSVLFGGFCSVIMLVIGMTIGSIYWISERTCCKKDLEESAIEHYYSEDIPEDSEAYWDVYFRYLPYEYPDPTSRHSPMKCVTPAELIDAEENRSAFDAGIWQTLDDVRTSLRNTIERQMDWVRSQRDTMRDSSRQLKSNVGKKVDRVRYKAQLIQQSSSSYVQSIRETGSTKLQSIKETGTTKLKTIRSSSSQYALRMKSGMVDRVATVRGQVKSLKEFCGTGDIGQTVSVMSVSTNVDSQEKSIEYKSHTLV